MTTSELLHGGETDAQPARRLTALSLDNVYVLSVVVITVAAALHVVVQPHDFWWHLANGRTIVGTGTLPTTDEFTFTRTGEPFFNQMWLAQVVLYGLYRAGGVPLVLTMHAVVIGVAVALLLRLCIRLTGRPRVSSLAVLGVALPLSFPNWAVRPQPYVLPLFVGFIWLLLYSRPTVDSRYRLGSWWLLPVLMVPWVNLHGSFALGLAAVTGVAVVEIVAGRQRLTVRQRQGLAVVTVATWGAALLNPRGTGVFRYTAELLTNPSVRGVSEWQPVTPTDVIGILYFLTVAVVVLLMVYGKRTPPLSEALVIIGLLLLGFTAERHTVWFALAAPPLITLQAASLLKAPAVRDPGIALMNGIVVAILLLGLVASLPWSRQALDLPTGGKLIANTPVGATDELADLSEPPERLFNELGYGSYLPWAMPEQPTFIDPRFELFPVAQIGDYQALSQGRDVAELTEKYRFDGFLVSQTQQPDLVKELRASPHWRLAYEDAEAALFLPGTSN